MPNILQDIDMQKSPHNILRNYAVLPQAFLRKLTHKRLRHVLLFVAFLLFVSLALIYRFRKKIRIEMAKYEEMQQRCLDFINVAVDRCLELKERKDQNRRFAAIKTDLPIKPIKMTLTTAVFHFKTESRDYVIKRVIVREDAPTQEDVISMSLRHKNIISTKGTKTSYFIDHTDTKQRIIWIFSEFLTEKISQRGVDGSEIIIRKIMKDSLEALVYMHEEMNMVHLDLKIANIMGEPSKDGVNYKLIDFGYSRDFSKEKALEKGEVHLKGKSYGTYPYKPPEVVLENVHGKPSDIWCLGAIAWFLTLGETPFYKEKGEKNMTEYRKFISGKSRHYFETGISDEIRDFIYVTMNRKRDKRPTARDLLRHPFITGTKTKNVVEDTDSGYESESTESDSSDYTSD